MSDWYCVYVSDLREPSDRFVARRVNRKDAREIVRRLNREVAAVLHGPGNGGVMRTPPEFKAALGARLRRARAKEPFTVAQVCASLGINHTYLYDLEAGRLQPAAYNLMRLADFYGVGLDWLLRG